MNENSNDLASLETLPDEENLSPIIADKVSKPSPYSTNSKTLLNDLPQMAFPFNFPSPYTSFLSPRRNNGLPPILRRSAETFSTPLNNITIQSEIKTAPAKVSRPLDFDIISDSDSADNNLDLLARLADENAKNVMINGDENFKEGDEMHVAICSQCKKLSKSVICDKCIEHEPLTSSKILDHCNNIMEELYTTMDQNSNDTSHVIDFDETNEEIKNENNFHNNLYPFTVIHQEILQIQQLLVV
eukprot:TRINITY_DN860_c0_g1_i1.p1 TRINITY_DN860_c0_g1~~TRINITY_DN860_c0_g1_i1.p1  ORF type:complete len:244 (-),score=81.75 TRINITY_DN860_c0_g1_i1:15-746(-)